MLELGAVWPLTALQPWSGLGRLGAMSRRQLIKLRVFGALFVCVSFAAALSAETNDGSRLAWGAGVISAVVSTSLGYLLFAWRLRHGGPTPQAETEPTAASRWARALAVALPLLLLASPLRGFVETVLIVGAGFLGGVSLGIGLI